MPNALGIYDMNHLGQSYQYGNQSAFYDYTIKYSGCGISRVVRGLCERAASRKSALNINNTGAMYNAGVEVRGTSLCVAYKATYENPAYGLRVCVPAE